MLSREPRRSSVTGELLARELSEAVPGMFVRTERLVVGVLRVGGDLLRDGPHFAVESVVVLRVTEQRFSGSSAWMRATMSPTGSSTSGSQISSGPAIRTG